MSALGFLFGFRGRLARRPYVIALAVVLVAFVVLRQVALASLPWIASITAPRGLNGGFILNGILAVLWAGALWASLAIMARRLAHRGRSGWWAVAALPPLVGLVMLHDEIVLVTPRFALPVWLEGLILVGALVVLAWVLYETVMLPSEGG